MDNINDTAMAEVDKKFAKYVTCQSSIEAQIRKNMKGLGYGG